MLSGYVVRYYDSGSRFMEGPSSAKPSTLIASMPTLIGLDEVDTSLCVVTHPNKVPHPQKCKIKLTEGLCMDAQRSGKYGFPRNDKGSNVGAPMKPLSKLDLGDTSLWVAGGL